MTDLDTIFDNIDEYSQSIDDLVKALKEAGINTFDEFKEAAKEAQVPVKKSIQDQLAEKFDSAHSEDEEGWVEAKNEDTVEAYQRYLDTYPEGSHRSEARDAILSINLYKSEVSDDEWHQIDHNDLGAIIKFIENNPASNHIEEARRRKFELEIAGLIRPDIKSLTKQIRTIQCDKSIAFPHIKIYEEIVKYINNKYISVDELIATIAEDNNYINAAVVNDLLRNGVLSLSDLANLYVDHDFIKYMFDPNGAARTKTFERPEPIDRVTKIPSTEVYFWGIPSSGKTCALGAILSAADSGRIARSMQKDNDCQGYKYMNTLSEMFNRDGEVISLPEGTPVYSTYEMGLVLEDEKKRFHPLTFIDLAGELLGCMYKYDSKDQLTEDQHLALDTVTKILCDNRTQNRKLHFFVIEYGAEDKKYEGISQSVYLDAAVAYIERSKIFKKDTDGIYILVTKSDKAKLSGNELTEHLTEYISDKYLNFIKGLKRICKHNEINDGNVEVLPFSLGEVVFQDYCKFNDETAKNVIQSILDRSYSYKVGKLQKLQDKLRR